MQIYNSTYGFKVPGHDFDSQCQLSIPTLDITPAITDSIGVGLKVIVSELPANPGMSVCTAFEILARKICLEFEIDPQKMVYLEHWGKWTAQEGGYNRESEEYALVEFQVIDNRPYRPNWRYLLEPDVTALQQFLKSYE
jgi:hypothetical protein